MATGRDLLLDVTLPPAVWRQSGRPSRGNIIRWSLAITFLLTGIAYPLLAIKLALVVAGVGLFFALPALADTRLKGIEAEVGRATKRNAAQLLGGLEQRQWVALFAPHGWVAWQKARLHLVAGDGRAAARALSECARMCNDPKNVALLSGQARALMLAGDRKDAREILGGLSSRDAMSPRDRLDYGTLLLGESGRASQAREAIEAAAEALGDHPQALAALAVVRARDEALDEGASLLERAEAADDVDDDPIAQELIKKARKALRPALKGAGKKKGKRGAKSDEADDDEDARGKGKGKARKKKKDRRRERRARRKAARASGKQPVVAAAQSDKSAVDVAAAPSAPPSRPRPADPEDAITAPAPASRPPATPLVTDQARTQPFEPKPAAPEVSETATTIEPRKRDVPKPAVSETATTLEPRKRDAPKPAVSDTATTLEPRKRDAGVKPAAAASKAATITKPRQVAGASATDADAPSTLFGNLSERVSMFKPPAVPGPPKTGAPRVPPPPKVGAPPKVQPSKAPPSPAASDDDWGDMLDGDDPPAPLKK